MKNYFLAGRKILFTSGILLILGAATVLYWVFFIRGIVYTDDARFDGDLVDFAPEINGTLQDVFFREGDEVHKGDVLFVLDQRSLQAAVAQVEAALESAQADLAMARAEYDKALHGPRAEDIKAAQARVMRLQAETNLADVELARVKRLYSEELVNKSKLVHAQAEYDSDKQALEEARQRLILLQKGTCSEDIRATASRVALAEAQVAESKASLLNATIRLDYATVRSSIDGFVERRWRDPGAMVPQGTPVLTLFDPSSIQVLANIEEKYLHRVSIGDSVDISVDAFPSLHLKGNVVRIMRATNSRFSLIPSEGVSGTFIKVPQRIRIRIAVEVPPDHSLGPGLSVEVRIHIRPEKSEDSRDKRHE
ncbi:MAG: hypothetical protein DRH37_03730 [Deltaproteobacteria bacterium]|nr:MAG: hypothetical protein DRH37_03730 [Deltaproteobacteria bacterium]